MKSAIVNITIMAMVACLVLTIVTLAVADEQEDLAKESQNPIGNLISLPFENNTHFKLGPDDKWANILNLKPVYPVTFGKLMLINRLIVPIIYLKGQDVTVEQTTDVGAEEFRFSTDDEFGPDWSLQLQVKLLFPKKAKVTDND